MAGLTFFRSLRGSQVSKNTLAALKSSNIPACSFHSSTTRHYPNHSKPDMPDNKFYELRTYKVKPASFLGFMKLTNEKLHLRIDHSKLIGFWASEIGGLNEVFHIWEYDSFAHRTAVRAALAKDETWQSSYITKAAAMWDVQENASGMLLPWKPLQDQPIKEGGIYELRSYVMKPGGLDTLKTRIMMRDEFYSANGCGKLMGAWLGDIGHVNTAYFLWNFVSADRRWETRAAVLKTDAFKSLPPNEYLTTDMRSKIMIPNPFSPLK